jgi:biopolymer transport protein TolR
MGMGVSSSSRRSKRGGRGLNSEINVTPLVDVMLVLLVIFMITAPMLTVAVPVDLPKTQARNISSQKEPLVITIRGNGEIFLQETRTKLDELAPRLTAITGQDPEARIFVRGDEKVDYGRIMQVMGTVSAAGFNKVALVAELPPPPKPAAR